LNIILQILKIDIVREFNPNDIYLNDITGLNMIKFVIYPHYTEKIRQLLIKLARLEDFNNILEKRK